MYFLKGHLQYLISGEGIYPLKEKAALLVNLIPPLDVSETSHIIDLALYYRIFIAYFSDIIRSLTDLMKKNMSFN